MFIKRDDGLGGIFLPFHGGALVLGCLLTIAVHGSGLWNILVFLGWYAAAFLGLLLLFYLVLLIFSSLTIDVTAEPPKEDHPHIRKLVVYVIGQLIRFGRARLHLTGEDKIPAEGRFLVVSNHRSSYDPICAVWALRAWDIGFITKPENHRIPIAGPLIFRANYLPIDRENPRNAMKTINAAAALIQNDVVSIGVYPEGTRGHGEELLPFHNGVFKIAQKANVPIVVLSTRGADGIHKSFPKKHTDVYLDVCAVIDAEEVAASSTAALSQKVRSILEDSLSPVKS